MVQNELSAKESLVRKLILMLAIVVAVAATLAARSVPLYADGKQMVHTYFLPMVTLPAAPAAKGEGAVRMVNRVRKSAGVPPVNGDGELSSNCFEHARYMAKNNVLTHDQDPNMPFFSPDGEECARHANAWLGTNNSEGWAPDDSIDGWMSSVAHRLWLLYPTTPKVGYGFFSTDGDSRAAAALDILSYANFDADEDYAGWPVRYPLEDSFVPPTRFPVTVNWRYFGPAPVLESTQLVTSGGRSIAHDANINLPANHKGIQILPTEDLPANSQFRVTVSGTYDGQPFKLSWAFHT